MSHFGDYMDGVPVKISEKYKRPPRIELPYSVIECPVRAQNVVDSVQYCSTFETNVLSKLKELRSAKETKKNERRHRLQLLEEAKQKKLDLIAAAEADEKLKQLSVSEVSYPSTDEISAISPDEKADKNCDTMSTHDNSLETTDVIPIEPYPSSSNAEPLNILQPIQVQANYPQNCLLDDPDPLQELKLQTKITKLPQYRNVDTLTFKDFESDTSSPFDNVELKTINDMELLAQVLQSQRESATSCQPQQTYIPDSMYTVPNCGSQVQIEGITYLPNNYMEQPIQGPSVMYSPQHYPVSNGYYVPTDNCDNTIQMDNVNMYMPNYQYYVPNPYNVDPTYYTGNLTSTGEVNQMPNGSTYIPEPYYYQYPPLNMQYPPNSYTIQNQNNENYDRSPKSINTMKSRSRSVPDIVKELNEELVSAKIRANERSYNASPAPKAIQPSSSVKKEERRRRKSENLQNPYEKLPPKLQGMCQSIHGMGFPLDRVARVCTLVGDSDKKVRILSLTYLYLKTL